MPNVATEGKEEADKRSSALSCAGQVQTGTEPAHTPVADDASLEMRVAHLWYPPPLLETAQTERGSPIVFHLSWEAMQALESATRVC